MSRAQVEPTAALVALFAVCAGVSLYATVLDGAVRPKDRDLARPTLTRVADAVADGGVARPDSLASAPPCAPAGYRLNVTLRADGRQWSVGPTPPVTSDGAGRAVSTRVAPGRIVPGRLRVEVWP